MYGLNALRPSIDGYASISRVKGSRGWEHAARYNSIRDRFAARRGFSTIHNEHNNIDTSHLKNLVPHHCSSPFLLLSIDVTTVPASPDR